MEKELLEKMRSIWTDKKMMLEDAKSSEEKDIIDSAYHDLFTVEEVLSKLAGLTDSDFEYWNDLFWDSLKSNRR